ncbi:ketopantoate reductase family protein [Aspergillus saccharolyticus JOP 1030-1]|uniref:2-dehydropantoate 2-reductase n=1 Tax=Aspergillus saccharolyticus JOP 1030-1 TaxID=1450539 RepID=A0A318ZK39_9EURO|nr:2-dehydropantoate 2-reductase family protein [Aspergillus saccharolyticus JOP 1030-1]PYH47876.1 2-dehydropantoate 2-reductase family protein [Aspergillus saccharolyticus JOP 1030-1]
MQNKVNVLLIGCGGIGTIAALNLQRGGQATVTAVLRSNYEHVKAHGFSIKSIDHGEVEGFKPSILRNTIPNITTESLPPYDYIVVTTKNYADIPPSVAELIHPAVTPGHTRILLLQNGLNIHKPLRAAFPTNILLSGVSFCGSHQVAPGRIIHEDDDELYIGAFRNPALAAEVEDAAAQEFVRIYGAGGNCQPQFQPDVAFSRWRKLLYNACLNPICAITDLDTGRIQLAEGAVAELVRPAMREIQAAASACAGVELPDETLEKMITLDPVTMYNPPSMQVDVRSGRFTEFENLVGEAVREGRANGVSMPTLTVLYGILKAMQWRTKERRGLVTVPAAEDHTVKK